MTLALFLVASLMSTRAIAQESAQRCYGLAKGKHSLSFSLERQSRGSLGLSTCLSPKKALGLAVSFGGLREHETDYESTTSHLFFFPMFKRYFQAETSVLMFSIYF